MSIRKKHKSSKTTFTATQRKAKYTGDHPHIVDTEGEYYFSKSQNSYVYRPASDLKSDWYRVLRENITDLE